MRTGYPNHPAVTKPGAIQIAIAEWMEHPTNPERR
jgi:hypothetical protein